MDSNFSTLEIVELTKQYGTFTALDHLTVRFDKGVYGLLGPNGAGKSTFLNLVTDNLQRTGGSILYNGNDISKLGAAYRRKIGYTPQVRGMYEDFTARDFLHYIGALKGMKGSECKKQTEQFLEIVNLSKDAHHRIGSFSGGMKQRTLIAAAMLDEPEILFLDEPAAGMNPQETAELTARIRQIQKDFGITIILIEHDMSLVMDVTERIYVLEYGRLIAEGTPDEIKNNKRVIEAYLGGEA